MYKGHMVYDYFDALMHPVDYYQSIVQREAAGELLSIHEAILMSWPFVIMNSLFRLVFIMLILGQVQSELVNLGEFAQLFYQAKHYTWLTTILVTSITTILFFPFYKYFTVEFWRYIVRLYTRLMGDERKDLSERIQALLTVPMTTSVLLMIPVLGEFARSLFSVGYFYQGLRKALHFSRTLSVIIIATPVIFLMLIAIMVLGILMMA